MLFRLLMSAALFLALTGCTVLPSGQVTQGLTPEQINALGKDPANVCIHGGYGPATFSFARAMPGSDVLCSGDGLKSTTPASGNPMTTVPITIVPSFKIEQR